MAKPGRPKGSGRGLVVLNVRVEPDVFLGFNEWRERQLDPTTGRPLTEAEGVRRLIRWALEQVGTVKELSGLGQGYAEGLRRGKADFNRALDEAWSKLRGES